MYPHHCFLSVPYSFPCKSKFFLRGGRISSWFSSYFLNLSWPFPLTCWGKSRISWECCAIFQIWARSCRFHSTPSCFSPEFRLTLISIPRGFRTWWLYWRSRSRTLRLVLLGWLRQDLCLRFAWVLRYPLLDLYTWFKQCLNGVIFYLLKENTCPFLYRFRRCFDGPRPNRFHGLGSLVAKSRSSHKYIIERLFENGMQRVQMFENVIFYWL